MHSTRQCRALRSVSRTLKMNLLESGRPNGRRSESKLRDSTTMPNLSTANQCVIWINFSTIQGVVCVGTTWIMMRSYFYASVIVIFQFKCDRMENRNMRWKINGIFCLSPGAAILFPQSGTANCWLSIERREMKAMKWFRSHHFVLVIAIPEQFPPFPGLLCIIRIL